MFRYYQTSEKTEWKVMPDSDKCLDEARAHGAIKLTVLALSEEIVDGTDKAELKYKGPLYIDIDMKENISRAAQSTIAVKQLLQNRGVPDNQIQLFASGSKGFHVIVNQKNFSSGRPVKGLPKVYQQMALALYVPGLDMQVYSMGRGVSWRIENQQRADGNYRVRITHEELDSIVVKGRELYDSLVSSPRAEMKEPPSPSSKCPSLESLFNHSRALAGKQIKTVSPVEDAKLAAAFKDQIPTCISDMREGWVRSGTNFNLVALSLATFAARSGMDQGPRDSLIDRAAERLGSTSYDTSSKRATHLHGLFKYADTRDDYKFSCAAARGKVQSNPCDGCALADKEDLASLSLEDIGIAVLDNSYFRLGKESNQRITTFTVSQATKVKGPMDDIEGALVTKAIRCDIVLRTGETHSRLITEPMWKSKSSFMSILEGIEGAVFLGNDLDVQKIKYLVFEDEDTMEEIVEVDTAGILMHKTSRSAAPVPVYVEPGFSVNRFGVVDTHALTKDVPLSPKITDIVVDPVTIKSMEKAFKLLLQINTPIVVGQLLGWFCASHLKAHVHYVCKEFPVVNVWGNAGSGKTKTTDLFMWLTGAGSKTETLSMALPHTTKFPLINFTTSSTTVPRVLEEFNEVRLGRHMYDYIHELIKVAFNQMSVSRGAIGGGGAGKVNATTVEMPVTAPLIYVSEQPVESPPLRQRTVSIGMDGVGRNLGTKYFKELEPMQEQLEPLAKMLTTHAVKTSVEDVQKRLDAVNLNAFKSLDHRPRRGIQVVLMGLQFLEDTLIQYKASKPTLLALSSLREQVKWGTEDWVKEVSYTSSKSEVTRVLEDFVLMAHLENSNTQVEGLKIGEHYVIDGNRLFINLPVCHALYKRFKRGESSQVVISNPDQMVKLLRSEIYFVSMAVRPSLPGISTRKKMVELDLAKMTDVGIAVELLEE